MRKIRSLTMLFLVPFLVLLCNAQSIVSCESQSFPRTLPLDTWEGFVHHKADGGGHSGAWSWGDDCNYTSVPPLVDGTPCNSAEVFRLRNFSQADNGALNALPLSFHETFEASTGGTFRAVGTGTTAGTANGHIGMATSECIGSCGTPTITFGPFHVGGSQVIQSINLSDAGGGCAAKAYHVLPAPAPCQPSPCHPCPGNFQPCSPIMFSISRMVGGPRANDRKGSENSVWDLTDAEHGRVLDISCSGHPSRVSWPKRAGNMGVLTLPNSAGQVVSCKEVFGNRTPQKQYFECGGNKACAPQGFLALRTACEALGGCASGKLTANDALYHQLRVLYPKADGTEELYTLAQLGIQEISLKWSDTKSDQFRDQWGNLFKYQAELVTKAPTGAERAIERRWAYDVFLTAEKAAN